ncbi:hypothetical protein QFW77_06200 [Luteimonas sp. RD2P54]|uniref:Peptidase C-terminal archaeal/bacterial domain-containing protein n=1 Tax=Luteimonas endophytica TaxID=3042023 RepID=A0ABT6J6W9_9GAMM|nr:pre-peptidase C-terminal domain-containing protein [Luteimonas endophytica]MDH5822582.1 hypothetical protein [Luteimonas endophytica]
MRLARSLIPFAIAALAAVPAAAAEPLPPGKTVEGTLRAEDRPADNGGRSHDYTLELTEGQLVAITVKSTEFDPVVILFGPDNERIAENDDKEGGGTDSLLVTSAPSTGKHTVRVNSLPMGDGHTGAYSVRAVVISED